MAIDRNKTTQQAEKLVLQGKVEAAIAQYELLVRDNPRDMNTINKIGDLYSRVGKRREAIAQFNKIGEFYSKDGFFLKAIAIYKKITKLDPTHLESYERLAELYAKQGLVLEARAQYQTVAEQYLRAGDAKKSIRAFKALVGLDPENLKHRSVLADLLARDGHAAEAAEEFARLGGELERKGMEQDARAMYERASAIQPGSPAVLARLASARAAAGDAQGGIAMVEEALRKPGDHRDLIVLLGDIHLKAGHHAEAESAFRRAVEQFPERADLTLKLTRARLAGGNVSGAFDALAPHAATLVKEGVGKEAVSLLERVVELDPSHLEAHRKLAEICASQKDEARAGKWAGRLMDLYMERGDYAEGRRAGEALLKLKPRDAGLEEKLALLKAAERDAAASATPPRETPAIVPASAAPSAPIDPGAGDLSPLFDLPAPPDLESEDEDFIAEHMTEADVFVKYGLGDRAVEQLVAVIERYPGYAPARQKLKEIYLEEGNREGARQEMVRLVQAYMAANDAAAAEEALAELKRYDPGSVEAARLSAALVPGAAPASQAPPPAALAFASAGAAVDEKGIDGDSPSAVASQAPQPVEEEAEERPPTDKELQEVDFYLARGLREEAVGVLRRLAEACGSHPQIVSRMRAAMSLRAEAAAGTTARSTGSEADEFEVSIEEEEATSAEEPARPPAAPETKPAGGLADLSDLASEIDAALGGDGGAGDALIAGVEATPEGHSLEEIVQAFKKGIEQQVGAEDFDTHYNLGIAYKEMGLMDEAIGEFQFAAKEPRLLVDCCSMLGICFREKGMSTLAVKWYRRGLEAAGSRDEETVLGLRYDLAELLAEVGEHRQAIELFTEVFGINSKYRDVAARIKELERSLQR